MIVVHEVGMACRNPTACSEQFITRLGHGASFKLKYDRAGDVAHGRLTSVHRQPPEGHQFRVEIYEVDEPPGIGPRYGTHDCAVQRPASLPTEQELRRRLDTPSL